MQRRTAPATANQGGCQQNQAIAGGRKLHSYQSYGVYLTSTMGIAAMRRIAGGHTPYRGAAPEEKSASKGLQLLPNR